MNYYELGQRIRKMRKAHGLSQEAMAEKIGISTTHMSHIETGNTKLSLPVFVDIADALEVNTDDLLSREAHELKKASLTHITELLENCSAQEVRFIEDILKSTIIAMRKYL